VVRRFIEQGKKLFYEGEFPRAEQSLLRAKARWADTNPEENQEIMLWLSIVQTARNVNSGRVIEEKDPLYTEMSQLHNLATEDFLVGRDLLEQDRVREALPRFTAAEDKLERIKILFPYNREARILSLRIEQLRDQDGFADTLTDIYNDAIDKRKSEPRVAYLDLKDLVEAFNPNYPGLQDALYALEIELRLRIPPPDPAKLAQSSRLTREATVIYEDRIRDLFPVALEKLNQALALDPNNREAIALKDRLQLTTGGERALTISSTAAEQLRRAEEMYLQGNFFEAFGIVERLLQDARNRNYEPLIELKKRIDTKI